MKETTGVDMHDRPIVYKIILLGLVIVMFLFPIIYADEFYLNIIISIFLYIILAASLNLVIRSGKLTIAHAAFMGIGAYTSAITVMRLEFCFPLALIASGFIACMVALIFGWVLLKLKGVYFVLITFAFGEVVRLFFNNMIKPFGGSTGITNIPAPQVTFFPGYYIIFDSKVSYYYLTLIVMLLTLLSIRRIVQSNIGKAIDCTNEAEHLAECTGINTFKFKLVAFGAGCFFAGLAGSIFAHYYRYISPESFTFWESVNLIVINVVGGIRRSIAGPILGALILVPLPEFLWGFAEYQRVIYGLILILVLMFMPGGVYGLLYSVFNLLNKKLKDLGN
jgi:branched-chain amino acid transport system permease protein